MKKYLLYLSLGFIVLFSQSCKKGVWVPDQPAITGSWILSESSQTNGNGWYYFNTGLEEGVFDFYNNGTARYDDGYNLMQGSWSIRRVSGGYYDQYGNYYTDLHDSFDVHVYDNYTHGSVDLHFDDVVFTGNKIIGTNYNGNTVSKYIFRRY